MRDRILALGCLGTAMAVGVLIWLFAEAGELSDWMTGEMPSPDGRLVARTWCTDGCDTASSRTITISAAADRPDVEREGDLVRGEMPDDDVAARVSFAESGEPSLIWEGATRLRIEAACLSDGNGSALPPRRFRGVELHFVRGAAPVDCWWERR